MRIIVCFLQAMGMVLGLTLPLAAYGLDGGVPSSQEHGSALDAGLVTDGGAPEAAPVLEQGDASVAGSARAVTQRVEPLTVVGTRESRTAGSAHVLRPADLERLKHDNPEAVAKQVPGVYARGEDGFGLRPNIGIRGTSPDRSKKVTLMEDGILFGPAPYSAPAAYYFPLVTRMELVRVIKGPGSVSFGPQTVGGAIDLVTRTIPAVASGAIDLAAGAFGYGKLHGYHGTSFNRFGYVLEGVHLRSTGFKQLDGGGDTGFEKNEWMWKGRYQLSTDPNASQKLGLKLGFAAENARESYLGLTDADFRATPYRRYRASMLDRMQWHRSQVVATYQARFRRAFTVDAAVYRHDMTRTWRKVNRMGSDTALADVLRNQDGGTNNVLRGVLAGELDSDAVDNGAPGGIGTVFIGPNRRAFVSQGVQAVAGWSGRTGAFGHRVEAGVRYHYDRIDRLHTEDGFRMVAGQLQQDPRLATMTTANARAWAHALALHISDAASVGPLVLTPGVRIERVDTWERDRLQGTVIAGGLQQVVIPGLGAYLVPFQTRVPSLGLLAGIHRGFSPAAAGQPLARPETSINYEAGARFSPNRLRLEAIGFLNDYQNLTSVCTLASGCLESLVGMQTNAGSARIYGVELFARAELGTEDLRFPLMASYTFTRTELQSGFTSLDPSLGVVQPGFELPFVPRHQAAATAAVETARGSLVVAATYVSPMREKAGRGSGPDGSRTDASFILDAGARVNLADSGQVYLSVRNLFGAEDIAARLPFGARPVGPRWVQVGTKWSF
jgi:Fe(3+) dicitrate transport protein